MSDFKSPVLYKKTATGKVQSWQIWTSKNKIFSESGQVGGKTIISTDLISEGKNIGFLNETTPITQAVKEAEARFLKQLKKGYTVSLQAAMAGKTDKVIEGGVLPMLAKVYEDHKGKIRFPCAVQPKLDGTRCIYKDGKFWSRTRKPIKSIAPLLLDLEQCGLSEFILDGELYIHGENNFEELVSMIRSEKELHKDVDKIEYHIYDVIAPDETFQERFILNDKLKSHGRIKIVETMIATSHEAISSYLDTYLNKGYEGAMVRNLDSDYQHKRSADLLKLKVFQDEEFMVADIEEGRGKLLGHVGALVCLTEEGQRFRVKMEGELSYLKKIFESPRLVLHKWLTVRFQGYTSANKVPRFPVGVRIREDYDL